MNESAIAYAFSLSQDPYPHPDYQVIRTESDLAAYLSTRNGEIEWMGADTESLPDGTPYCLTFSHTPGTGRLIYARDTDLIREFIGVLTCYGLATEREYIPLLFHNYLHDVTVFEAMGIPIGKFRDTMVMAYNLCLGGGGDDDQSESRAGRGFLGLKILAYRELNMVMASFEDTVHPWSLPHMMRWLEQGEALLQPVPDVPTCICTHLRTSHVTRGKTGKVMGACGTCDCTRYKAGKASKRDSDKQYGLLHRKLHGLIQGIREGKPDLDPWDRVKQWHDWDRATLEMALGPAPVPSIAHVPEPELLQYAVRDADATLRLYHHLCRLKPWIFWK